MEVRQSQVTHTVISNRLSIAFYWLPSSDIGLIPLDQ